MNVSTTLGPGVGPYFSPVKCIVYNRAGATVALGDVLMLDHLAATTESSKTIAPHTDIGGDAAQPTKCWPLGNAILPATTGIGVLTDDPGAIFGVVTSLMSGAGADNTKVELTLFGLVNVSLAGSTNFGADLYPADGVSTLTGTQADGVRCLAKALCADSSTGVKLALFNGLLSPGSQTFAN